MKALPYSRRKTGKYAGSLMQTEAQYRPYVRGWMKFITSIRLQTYPPCAEKVFGNVKARCLFFQTRLNVLSLYEERYSSRAEGYRSLKRCMQWQ